MKASHYMHTMRVFFTIVILNTIEEKEECKSRTCISPSRMQSNDGFVVFSTAMMFTKN